MKELQRLVRIVNKYSANTNPLLNLQDDSILETKLFHLLSGTELLRDDEILMQLYGDNKVSGSSFRMLKSRFKKKLYGHLHFLKVPNNQLHPVSKALYLCTVQLTEARALILFSEFKASLKTLEQVLQLTTEYDLTDQNVMVMEEMLQLYADLNDEENHETYFELLEKAYRKQALERKARTLFNRALFLFRKKTSERASHLHNFPDMIQELEVLWEESSSSYIFNCYQKLQIFYSEQLGHYDRIALSVQRAVRLLEQGKLNRHRFSEKYFNFIQVYALLQCGKYEEGLRLAKEKLKELERESHNWFAFMENYTLLALHSKKYRLVADLLEEVAHNSHFNKILEENKERWELLRRFYSFVAASNGEDSPLSAPFIQELRFLPKDKSGFNLALLVLEVLEKLADGQADELEAQAERVRKYSQKYLRGEKAERPRLFMRLLLLALTKQNADNAREQGQQLLERLQATPLPGDAFTEVEIVPYEHLWELAQELMERQRSQ